MSRLSKAILQKYSEIAFILSDPKINASDIKKKKILLSLNATNNFEEPHSMESPMAFYKTLSILIISATRSSSNPFKEYWLTVNVSLA